MHYKPLLLFFFSIYFFQNTKSQTWVPVASFNTDIEDVVNHQNDLWIGGQSLLATYNGASVTNQGTGSGVVSKMTENNHLDLYAVVNNRINRWDGDHDDWVEIDGIAEPQSVVFYDGIDLYGGTSSGGVYSSPIFFPYFDSLSTHFSGNTPTIKCFARYNNVIYVGGRFSHFNGSPISGVAKRDSTSWKRPSSTISLTGIINCMEVYMGELYVGGSFFLSNGTAFNIAKWNDTIWTPVGGGISNGSVTDLLNFGGNLYAVGDFTSAGGVYAKNAAKWDGSTWQSLNFSSTSGYLKSITYKSNPSNIYAGATGEGAVNHLYRLSYAATGVGEIGSDAQVEIFPNPTNSVLHVSVDGLTANKLEVADLHGGKVLETSNTNFIDISELPNGIYFVNAHIHGKHAKGKFVKNGN